MAPMDAVPPPEDPPLAEPAYRVFDRAAWAALRASTPLSLTRADIAALKGLNETVSLADVQEIYLPLSRLLNLQVRAARRLAMAQDAFLGHQAAPPPYVIGIAGSVAVGKSTLARVLRAILARWPDHPRVELVTTDGFLHPTKVLEERGLMRRKGFPESYDLKRMLGFLNALKAGQPEVAAPVYSHLKYDIIPGEMQVLRRPDIVIFEGLNVLQHAAGAPVVASDYFDFSVYLDAAIGEIEAWYIERFLLLQKIAFPNPDSYFHHYRDLPLDEAKEVARGIWRSINLPNLQQNIQPTRHRARLVLRKGHDHSIEQVWLRRM
ncbi:type I pantothenate kinase [Belnapia sp. T18]|uniref:Pantothenate kinase n=1 Tax=Belnapia arida TaxID=2804533 RepID=A0ABS1U860_9PROT|nr:type I pantothenate kinase [Belnapia arida]MBL6080139.1 type I pantothenate kinase [Belnapia arida]